MLKNRNYGTITLSSHHTIRLFMVELVILQSLSYMAGAIGVCIAAAYYTVVLREQRQTRQFQLLMQIREIDLTKEGQLDILKWRNMEWSDYDDFEKKYGSDVNPENYAIRMINTNVYHILGILIKNKAISSDLVYQYMGMDIIMDWNKYGEIIRTQRRLYNVPEFGIYWEYLYDEMVKIAKSKGSDITRVMNTKYTEEVMKKATSIQA